MSVFSFRNPFDSVNSLQRLQDELERVFEKPVGFDLGPSGRGVFPPVNVLADSEGLIVRLEVPGVSPKDLSIESTGRTLTISGKRESEASEHWEGEFSRSLRLPPHVDAAKADATYKHGVLTIRIPKKEELQPRQIEVKQVSA